MAIGSHAELMAEAKRVAHAAAAKGVEQTDFGGEAQGWPLTEGATTEHPQGTDGEDPTGFEGLSTVEGIMLLTPDGEIHEVWGVHGENETVGKLNQWGTKPPSKAKLSGQSSEPFAEIAAGLQKLERLAS